MDVGLSYDYPVMTNESPDPRALRPYAEQGRRMREAREALDIDQADIARRVDVEPQTYWRYEAGERSPKRTRMERIARILGHEPEYFTRGVEPPKSLSRGDALAMIEDELGLTEAQKTRLRYLLAKYKHHRIDSDYLEAAADLVRFPGVADETVHATAVTVATAAQAEQTSARKLRTTKRESDMPKSPPVRRTR